MSEGKTLTPQVVVEAYREYKQGTKTRGNSVATSNWPSVLAHDCPAYAVYNRIVPGDQRRAISPELSMIFSEGNDQARMVLRDLHDAGFVISNQESQLTWSKYQISGRQDLKIWKEGFKEKIDVEVKSCADYTYQSINSQGDLANTPKDWLRKWYKQVALYMVLQGVEKYWLLLKSKQKGSIKIIEFKMDDKILEAANAMVNKAEWVNHLIQIGEMPKPEDKIEDPDYCCSCEFFDTCMPALAFGPGAVIFADEEVAELQEQLDRREGLKPFHKEYEELDEQLKQEIKMHASGGQSKFVIGAWIATVAERNRKAYEVKACTFKVVNFVKPEASK